jgi:hypothetical protein
VRRTVVTCVATLVLAAGLTGSASADTVYAYWKLGSADYQVTRVRASHQACGDWWAVNQVVHWGVITDTRAYIRYIRFNYWKPSRGYILGGGAAAYNANGYLNDSFGDRDRAYTRASATNSYAGGWTKYFNKWFYRGQTNGRVVVAVDKHTQLGSYLTGDDCHGKFTAVYYR